MRIPLRFQIALAGLLIAAAAPALGQVAAKPVAASPWDITLEPAQPVNGSPVLFRVTAPAGISALRGTWQDRQLDFRFDGGCSCWYAIAGVGLDAAPGKYALRLQASSKETDSPAWIFNVTVGAKHYPTTVITVPPAFVQPPPEIQPRIAEEEALKKQVFSHISPETLWSGRFLAPVENTVSGGFGAARTYNGTTKSHHQGLDYHAAVGTTVRATNAGTVILARSLYFEGNCVVIDHGDGLLTLYMHLSQIKVQEGAKIAGGDLLGLSGSTGRANGPHLHFAVRWQGLYLDPGTLLTLHPPSP